MASELLKEAPGEKLFLLGNEAIARGALEGGVHVAASYPGTPASEILMNLASVAKEAGIYVEWSTNEKVALEVALAASICGLRAMCSMKHVGLNVAHDPFVTASYIGAKGGFLVVSADDPWAWSSQNEQDNRWIAKQAYVPVLEPSDVQEAKDMTASAFDLSEKYGHIFMLRTVTRIGHARGDVVLGPLNKERRKGVFKKDPSWLTYVPATARKNRPLMIQRFDRIKKEVDKWPFNRLDLVDGSRLGVIASGLSYAYALEAISWLGLRDKVSLLKVGTTNPMPEGLVKELLSRVDEVLVIEELEPFVELHVKALAGEEGIRVKVHGKDYVTLIGELSTRHAVTAIAKLAGVEPPVDFSALDKISAEVASKVPPRPPILCPGCPHRASFYAIKVAAQRVAKSYGEGVEPIYPGDIGCYTLAYQPPFETVDTCVCMGGSIGIASGLAKVVNAPIIPCIGDSTFFHAGIPPLINAVYNKSRITVVVLDNLTTGMTGGQPHPGTGVTAMGEPTVALRAEDIAKACGVGFVEVVDPYDVKAAIDVMTRALRYEGPALVVMRRACALDIVREKRAKGEEIIPYRVDQDKCKKCDVCVKMFACPSIVKYGGTYSIDPVTCMGCGVCAKICPYRAIVPAEGALA
ncbi:MAG: indolepyruvate ferredoxin oxidoreductase subunit alpha [Candidatus Nezhaarchaeota archaeon]|nr:indolepyruvate ferredoxin oxidoreductase subunit alpha [Candidatus Nezhaarchaeota archaeon]